MAQRSGLGLEQCPIRGARRRVPDAPQRVGGPARVEQELVILADEGAGVGANASRARRHTVGGHDPLHPLQTVHGGAVSGQRGQDAGPRADAAHLVLLGQEHEPRIRGPEHGGEGLAMAIVKNSDLRHTFRSH